MCFNFKFPSVRNIFLFIRKFSNFLLFLVLQIVSLYFLFSYNKFHQAAFMGVAGEFTGRISEKYNNVEYYFKLKQTNEALSRQNEHLGWLIRMIDRLNSKQHLPVCRVHVVIEHPCATSRLEHPRKERTRTFDTLRIVAIPKVSVLHIVGLSDVSDKDIYFSGRLDDSRTRDANESGNR